MPNGHGASPNPRRVWGGKSPRALSGGEGKAEGQPEAISLSPHWQEKPRSEEHGRPYRKPTPVGWGKCPQANEATFVKELGNLTP